MLEALSYFLRNNNPWKLVVVVLAFKKLNFGGKGKTRWWITDGANTTATYNTIPGKSDASGAKDMA